MEHNSQPFPARSDSQDWPQAGESSGAADEEDGFDCYGFTKTLHDFVFNPKLLVEMTGVNDDLIERFIKQVNHPQATDPFGVARGYNNETEPGLWVQASLFQFREPWISRCDWNNNGELLPSKKMKSYRVFYWTHKEIPSLKFRKYCITGLPLAVFIVVYETDEPSTKKIKLTPKPISNNNQANTSNYSSPALSSPSHHSDPYSDESLPTNVRDKFEAVHLAGRELYSQMNNNNNYNDQLQSLPDSQTPVDQATYVNLHLQVAENTERSKQNEKEIEMLKEQHRQLTAKHVDLDVRTVTNTREIEELTTSLANLEIITQNRIIQAVVYILRQNNGTYQNGKKFASKVRERLEDKSITTMEVNRILKNILEKRGILRRTADQTLWILNEELAKSFGL